MLTSTLLVLGSVFMVITSEEPTKPTVEVITEKSFVDEHGYNFEFKTSDGTSRKEEGELITVGEAQGIGIKGSYSFVAPDGQEYEVNFTADDKGYNPTVRIVAPAS